MKNFPILFGLVLAAGAVNAQQYTISTIAGVGAAQGYFGDGGPATSAELDFPFRVAVDAKGNFYIADYLTHVVRKVTAAGIISTIAGTGSFGFQGDGGPGIQAFLTDVHGLAVDSSGNVYIADTHNSRVRRVDSAGVITTLAGNGTAGYSGDGALAINAALNLPAGLAVDSSGNVYISDYGNSTVRKVDSKGNITTVAGTGAWGFGGDGGPAGKATLAAPVALALDGRGNLYISDAGNTNIRKITTDGNIQTVASNIDAGSIAVDGAGTIYFPGYANNTVQKILSNGTQFTIAGNGSPGFSGDGGPATGAQLKQPYGVAVDSSGNVYVADTANQAIRLLSPAPFSVTVLNAASGLGGSIAPGEIVAVYGAGLGPATLTTAQPAGGLFGTELAGTTVTFNGVNAPVLYTSANQVGAIVPYAMPINGTADVTVSYQGQSFTTAAVPVAASAPGIFTLNASGSGQAAALNQNNSVNGSATPASQGSTVTLYLTGEGQTNPPGVDGRVARDPLPAPVLGVAVYVAGQQVPVTYAGAAPGLVAGVMQVNAQIPANLLQTFAAGPVPVPVTVYVSSAPSQVNVTIAVAP